MNQKLKELSEALKDSSQDAALKGIITQMHIAYYNDDLQGFNEAMEKVKRLYLKVNQEAVQIELTKLTNQEC
jgi:hypothetical protein